MAAVIIRKKDVEQLGKELIKKVFDFLHDEYILKNFIEMKEVKNNFLKDLVYKKFKNYNVTVKEIENTWGIEYEDYDENNFEDDLKCVTDKVKNGSLDISIIFQTLNNLDLDDEIDGDLYFKTKAFLNLFMVIDYQYSYLED